MTRWWTRVPDKVQSGRKNKRKKWGTLITSEKTSSSAYWKCLLLPIFIGTFQFFSALCLPCLTNPHYNCSKYTVGTASLKRPLWSVFPTTDLWGIILPVQLHILKNNCEECKRIAQTVAAFSGVMHVTLLCQTSKWECYAKFCCCCHSFPQGTWCRLIKSAG